MTETNKVSGIIKKVVEFFENKKTSPSPAEVLCMIDKGLSRKSNALSGVQNGDLKYSFNRQYDGLSFEQESPYCNFTEAVNVLQGALLVYIEQEIKAEQDPATKRDLMRAKAELLKNPGNFGPTTSLYLDDLHDLAGICKIPASPEYDKNELEQITLTKKGDSKFNFLSLAIIRRGLEAARAGKSFKGAVKGMFDTREKIKSFQDNPANKVDEKNKLKLEEYTPIELGKYFNRK